MSGLTKEQRVLYNQLQNAIGDFVEGFAKGFNDKMKEKHDVVKFDGTPPEDKQMLFDELGDFVESFAKGFNDKMKEKHEIETKQVTNKAIGIGITCGVIAALAVGIGCGVAGYSIINIGYSWYSCSCCAGSWTCCWWGITYAVLKPSGRLEEAQEQEEKEKVPA